MKKQDRYIWVLLCLVSPVALLLLFPTDARAQVGNCPPGTTDLGYLPGTYPYTTRICKASGAPGVTVKPDSYSPCGSRLWVTDTTQAVYLVPPAIWISPTYNLNLQLRIDSPIVTETFTIDSLQEPDYITWTTNTTVQYVTTGAGTWANVAITATGNYTNQWASVFRISSTTSVSYSISSIRLFDDHMPGEAFCQQTYFLPIPLATSVFSSPLGIPWPTPLPDPGLPVTDTITGTLQMQPFWDIGVYTYVISALQTWVRMEGMTRLFQALIFVSLFMGSIRLVQWIARGGFSNPEPSPVPGPEDD